MSQSSPTNSSENAAIAWLARLRSPEFNDVQKDEFTTWLQASPANQLAFIKADTLWKRGVVLNQTRENSAKKTPFWGFGNWQGLAVACTLIFAIAIYFSLPNQHASITSEVFITHIGEQREQQLHDGSSVTLNTNTRLHVTLKPTHRIATLEQGEALFHVQSDPNRPFYVVTKAGLVRVLGTRFSVRTIEEDALVTVIDGSVGLGNTNATIDNYVSANTLTANQKHSIKSAQLGIKPEQVDALAALAWRNKQLIYRGETLGDVVNDINRYFEEDIQLTDLELSSRKVIVVIQLSDAHSTISALTKALSLHADFSQNQDSITISSPQK